MSNKKTQKKNTKSKFLTPNIVITIVAVILSAIAIMTLNGNNKGKGGKVAEGTDIVISKSEITSTVSFYPAKSGKTNMEIMAVKASDGTIRTAFNTCQVCNGSPRAYYEQDGDVVICMNCGNRFSMDMIGEQRGGCNPVPIMKDEKTEDDSTITISKDFISQNSALFTKNWKTQ